MCIIGRVDILQTSLSWPDFGEYELIYQSRVRRDITCFQWTFKKFNSFGDCYNIAKQNAFGLIFVEVIFRLKKYAHMIIKIAMVPDCLFRHVFSSASVIVSKFG